MTGAEFRGMRDKLGFTGQQLAEYLNEITGRSYTATTVSQWERDSRKIPAAVEQAVQALVIDKGTPDLDPIAAPAEPGQDTMPVDAEAPQYAATAPLGTSGIYARACEDLWGMVAMLVVTTGSLSKSPKLITDGQIIDSDKKALGRAWGKLAETNDTFRKMLVSATSGGAWLEVALVTSATAGKMFQNHHAHRVTEGKGDPRAGVEDTVHAAV